MSGTSDHRYRPDRIEAKWQRHWERSRTYDTARNRDGPKCYVLDMFPYPSGSSMHVGHPRGYVATDVYARFKRMHGFQVLHPMGWDSFGLPAEETAIARQEYPARTVDRNIAQFKSQLRKLGLSYDWDREIKTTDPGFYRHTQRLFLEFFRRGLAYNAVTNVNWCAALGTVLANEDIVNGLSERGGHPIELVPMRQWMLKISAYADRLVRDLDDLPLWPERVKNAQREWIGRSEGHALSFALDAAAAESEPATIKVFTTRLETVCGVTFIALSPGSALAQALAASADNAQPAAAYQAEARSRTERDRLTNPTKTGIVLQGVHARHPITDARIPVILADYVLEGYGTGAIMGVPAHDERDLEIAHTLDLPVIPVIDADDHLINSGDLDGLDIDRARQAIAQRLDLTAQVQFKMRDWVFSRQRFWGEPFPIVWIKGTPAYEACKSGAIGPWLPAEPIVHIDQEGDPHYAVPIIPEHLDQAQLPVVERYTPTGHTEGPLAGLPS